MNFYVWWMVSIAASFGMGLQSALKVIKDVADEGYKFDIKELSNIQKQINPNGKKNSLLEHFIPGYNIFKQFQRAIQYNQNKEMILDQLSVMGVLERMTEEEQKEYQKKPTGLNAIQVLLKSNTNKTLAQKKSNADTIIFTRTDKNGQEDTIKFQIIKDDISILEVSGPISALSRNEQKEILIKGLKEIEKEIMDKYGDMNSFAEELTKDKIINLDTIKEKERNPEDRIRKEEQISEKKEELISLKKELLSLKENQTSEEKENIKVHKLR